MSYHDTLDRLTEDVQTKVLAVYRAWREGVLTQEQFVQLAAAHVAHGNARAVALADLALAATLSVELGVPRPTVGVPVKDDTERLREGLTTLAAAAAVADVTARLERFATAEPAHAAQVAWVDGMTAWDDVEGWMRQVDPGACEVCQGWASESRVFPPTVRMIHHPGCKCTPKPVLKKGK